MKIRPATFHDVEAIAEVHVASWRTAYRKIFPDEFLDNLSLKDRTKRWEEILGKPDQFTFVAEVDGKVVGFVNGGPEREGRDEFEGELYAIYLLEEWQGQGIGQKLFQQVVATLLEREMSCMLVWCLEENPYRQFYEALGGELVDRKTVKIGGREYFEVAYGWEDLRGIVEKESGD